MLLCFSSHHGKLYSKINLSTGHSARAKPVEQRDVCSQWEERRLCVLGGIFTFPHFYKLKVKSFSHGPESGQQAFRMIQGLHTHYQPLKPWFFMENTGHEVQTKGSADAGMKNRKDSYQETLLHIQLLTNKTGNQEYDKYYFLHSMIRLSDTMLDTIGYNLKSIANLQLFIKGRGRKGQIPGQSNPTG